MMSDNMKKLLESIYAWEVKMALSAASASSAATGSGKLPVPQFQPWGTDAARHPHVVALRRT